MVLALLLINHIQRVPVFSLQALSIIKKNVSNKVVCIMYCSFIICITKKLTSKMQFYFERLIQIIFKAKHFKTSKKTRHL